MLQTVSSSASGQPAMPGMPERSATWGRMISQSIAHLVQIQRELKIEYSSPFAAQDSATVSGTAMLPHIVSVSAFRFHALATDVLKAAGKPGAALEAQVECDIGSGRKLKLWGSVTADQAAGEPDAIVLPIAAAAMVPMVFTVAFWEISRVSDPLLDQMLRQSAEKDRKIGQLVALSMCSQ